ncbi:hypothetical protein CLOM_g2139 [Closterium sp. NIES-68]|nr:hypothetical protein CLOM_g2139 [Closterium sp. NIES-68]
MRVAACRNKRLVRVLLSLPGHIDSAMACRIAQLQSLSVVSASVGNTDAFSSGVSPSSFAPPSNGSKSIAPSNLVRALPNPRPPLHSAVCFFNPCRPLSPSRLASSLLSSSVSTPRSPSFAPLRASPSLRARQFPRAIHSEHTPSEVAAPISEASNIGDASQEPDRRAVANDTAEPAAEATAEATAQLTAKARSDDSSTGAAEAGSGDASEAKEEVRKTVLVVRRRRAGGVGLAAFGSEGDGVVLSDLLTVPGVGPRNLEKLKARGFSEVASLTQLYRDKFAFHEAAKGRSAMQEYLKSHVGIIRKDHAARITDFVCLRVAQEEGGGADAEDAGEGEGAGEDAGESGAEGGDGGGGKGRNLGRQKNRLTFCVEGNISVGKTTFLERIVGDAVKLHDLVEVVPEPVARWQSVGQEKFNILEAFYEEPERYAYTFQNYVFVTRMMQERESAGGARPIRLMERSVFSDRMVFVRAVHEAKWMSEMEVSIYDSWFDPVVSALPGLVPDGFIYLRAQPDTCHRRLKERARGEEAGVSLDYLVDLHNKHEQWLLPAEPGGVWGGGVVEDDTPEIIKGRVFALEGGHLHSSIQQVPALVLDCDAQIDLIHDRDAKELYTRQVQAFFDFVQRRKEQQKQRQRQQRQRAGISPDSPLLIPSPPSLSMPPGIDFDPSSFLRS